MRGLKDLWKISRVVYRELLFQATMLQSSSALTAYTEQQTEQATTSRRPSVYELAKRTERSFVFFKVMTLIVCASIVGSTIFFIIFYPAQVSAKERLVVTSLALLSAILISAFVLFFMIIIQASMLYSPRIYQPLLMLDLSDREISKILALAFFRMFDAYLIGSLIISLIAFIMLGKALAGLIYAIFLGATYILILWLVVAVSRKFRGFSAPAKTKTQQVARILLILGYVLVFSLFYVIPYAVYNILPIVIDAFSAIPETYQRVLINIPPLSATYLVASFYVGEINTQSLMLPLASSVIYLLLSVYSLRALFNALASIPYLTLQAPTRTEVPPTVSATMITAKIRSPLWGHVIKDLRLTLRDPNYAIVLFFGPIILIVYTLAYSLLKQPTSSLVSMVYIATILTLSQSPSLLLVEKRGLDYLLSLPVSYRDIAKSKASLMTLSYAGLALSTIVIFAILELRYAILGCGLLLNLIGAFTYSYKIIRKILYYVLETGKSLLIMTKASFMLYLIGLGALFGVIPVAIVHLGIEFGQPHYAFAIVLALQAIFFITYKR